MQAIIIELQHFQNWQEVAHEAKARLNELRFLQAGIHSPTYVRIQVPLPLARQKGHQLLESWLVANDIQYLIVGTSGQLVSLHIRM